MSQDELTPHIHKQHAFGQAVCQRIGEHIAKLGFAAEQCPASPQFEAAEFTLVVDPFSQSRDLVGYWYDERKLRVGQIKFHGDGSFYAEYDIAQPHPSKKRFFVEAINAWGQQDNIKTEAKLLEMPDG